MEQEKYMEQKAEMEQEKRVTQNKNIGHKDSQNRPGRLWYAALFILLILQILLLLYYGNRKAGFHEDEYYSYYSTNRTAGLFEPDREWMDRDTFRNEFVVLEGEGFRYGLVSTVQSWDVHPPFFYFLLHTVCSLFPGVFSKWLGIGVNIAAFAINFVLLCWLSYMVSRKNQWLTFAVAAVYGFNGVIISGVMFIRMYEWLTVFVLSCACLHVWAIIKKDMGIRSFLLPLMAVNYLGFLTQYYYIIFLFFTAAFFCLWRLWTDRKLWNCIKYGMVCGVSLLLAVFSYPASLSHIFRGYRGTGAASEFLDAANTGDRLRFFGGLVNEYLFDGFLGLWVLLIVFLACLLAVGRYRAGKRGILADAGRNGKTAGMDVGKNARADVRMDIGIEGLKGIGTDIGGKAGKEDATVGSREKTAYGLLLFAVCGYFFTVSKTALLLYETSNRYQLPIYGILLLLVMTAVYGLWTENVFFFMERYSNEKKLCEEKNCGKNQADAANQIDVIKKEKRYGNQWERKASRFTWACGIGLAAIMLIFLADDIHGLVSGKVIFLYEEDGEHMEYAKANAHMPVIVLYNDATPYHVWWCSQELMQYDRIYFASEGNLEKITDEVINSSERAIVYAADYDTQGDSLEMILESCPDLEEYRLISRKGLWSVYELE